jgi:predicted RNA-binding Zn-ribbon protein involved in translation (DUF1610 family)
MTVAQFRCEICGDVAASLELIPSEEQNAWQLTRQGFLLGKSVEVIKNRVVPAVHQALTDLNARKLYAIRAQWAPFFCPACGKVYCIKHWQITPKFGRDFSGQYAGSDGVCPNGHRRQVDG